MCDDCTQIVLNNNKNLFRQLFESNELLSLYNIYV